jgi:hypothetical protein
MRPSARNLAYIESERPGRQAAQWVLRPASIARAAEFALGRVRGERAARCVDVERLRSGARMGPQMGAREGPVVDGAIQHAHPCSLP